MSATKRAQAEETGNPPFAPMWCWTKVPPKPPKYRGAGRQVLKGLEKLGGGVGKGWVVYFGVCEPVALAMEAFGLLPNNAVYDAHVFPSINQQATPRGPSRLPLIQPAKAGRHSVGIEGWKGLREGG